MPRNKARFEYIEVSLPKESELYQLLTADAHRSAQSLAQIMLVRLADYYGGSQAAPQRMRESPPAVVCSPEKPPSQIEEEPVFSPTSSDDREEDEVSFDLSGALASAALFDSL